METKPYSPTEVLELTAMQPTGPVVAAPDAAPAAASPAPAPTLSIIVPTKNETGNITPLLKTPAGQKMVSLSGSRSGHHQCVVSPAAQAMQL